MMKRAALALLLLATLSVGAEAQQVPPRGGPMMRGAGAGVTCGFWLEARRRGGQVPKIIGFWGSSPAPLFFIQEQTTLWK